MFAKCCRSTAFALLLALLSAHGAFAQGTDSPRRDGQIFKDVARQVTGCPHFTVFDDIRASVEDGVVTLQGKVTMPSKRNEIERRVATVPGVRHVVNRVTVLPVSAFDDDLRYKIAHAIYADPSFWRYGTMANPPIHIIVENGRVTLTGVVGSNVDRVLARSIATRFLSLGVDCQLRTDAEVAEELEKIRD